MDPVQAPRDDERRAAANHLGNAGGAGRRHAGDDADRTEAPIGLDPSQPQFPLTGATGIPQAATLERLGLGDVADDLARRRLSGPEAFA